MKNVVRSKYVRYGERHVENTSKGALNRLLKMRVVVKLKKIKHRLRHLCNS
jgi:hypothetical protein